MLGRLFRRETSPPAPAAEAARALGQVGRDQQRALKRAMTDQLRADLRAKGHESMTPWNWGSN
ncbi:hypothetical protein [Novosphingobium sp.]|uniref:hypothetical protein n=1 Tax=Novosphingobium sp. TaxID=1874826 RepID=UPI0028AE05F4|nr:hypothetical protein [Novosphingobium sp.]